MSRRPHRVDPKLLDFARQMRREAAPAEAVMWTCLRSRRLGGFKFRRQDPVTRFVPDFYCPECKVLVELDGDSHSDQVEYDRRRTVALEREGLSVLRFENPDVFDHLDGVLEAILEACERRKPKGSTGPSPNLSPEYGGEE